MKRIIALFSIFIALAVCVGVTSRRKKETIVIYTSTEDYNMELLQKRLDEKFPNYDIDVVYMSTSNIASKVIEEKDNCEADIVYALEYAYIEKVIDAGMAASLEGEMVFGMSKYEDDLVTEKTKNYVLPNMRSGAGVIVNKEVLKSKNLQMPKTYDDLLKPEYKGLISMPSPKSSGTGYSFYFGLVNMIGEEAALEYFDRLTENGCLYTDSGSGPVNKLCLGESAIGIGMICQGVEEINKGRTQLEVLAMEGGSPFGIYGTFILNGKKNTATLEIMDYIDQTYTNESCAKYYPEPVFKGITYEVANFPKIEYCTYVEANTIQRKEDLLRKWTH